MTKCDSCGCDIKPAIDFADANIQPDSGLIINFEGGYGMFFDSLGTDWTDQKMILCEDCAFHLGNAFSPIGERLRKLRGK